MSTADGSNTTRARCNAKRKRTDISLSAAATVAEDAVATTEDAVGPTRTSLPTGEETADASKRDTCTTGGKRGRRAKPRAHMSVPGYEDGFKLLDMTKIRGRLDGMWSRHEEGIHPFQFGAVCVTPDFTIPAGECGARWWMHRHGKHSLLSEDAALAFRTPTVNTNGTGRSR